MVDDVVHCTSSIRQHLAHRGAGVAGSNGGVIPHVKVENVKIANGGRRAENPTQAPLEPSARPFGNEPAHEGELGQQPPCRDAEVMNGLRAGRAIEDNANRGFEFVERAGE